MVTGVTPQLEITETACTGQGCRGAVGGRWLYEDMSSTQVSEVAASDTDSAVAAQVSRIDPLVEVGFICGRLNAAHADLIALVTRLEADHSWEISGIRSLEHWLRIQRRRPTRLSHLDRAGYSRVLGRGAG